MKNPCTVWGKQPEKLVFIPEKFTMVAEPNRRGIARCSKPYWTAHNFLIFYPVYPVGEPDTNRKTICHKNIANHSAELTAPLPSPIPKAAAAAVRQKSALPPRYLMVTKDSSFSQLWIFHALWEKKDKRTGKREKEEREGRESSQETLKIKTNLILR